MASTNRNIFIDILENKLHHAFMIKFENYQTTIASHLKNAALLYSVVTSSLFFYNSSSAMDTDKLNEQTSRSFIYEHCDNIGYPSIIFAPKNYFIFENNLKIERKPFHILLFMYNRHYGIFLEDVYGKNYCRLTEHECITDLINTYPESILDIIYLWKERSILTIKTYEKAVVPVFEEIAKNAAQVRRPVLYLRLFSALCRYFNCFEFCRIAMFKIVENPIDIFSTASINLQFEKIEDKIEFEEQFNDFCKSQLVSIISTDMNTDFVDHRNYNDYSFLIKFDRYQAVSKNLNLLELSALSGSVRSFKFFLMNNIPIDNDTIKYALIGGDLDIITICYNAINNHEFNISEIIGISTLKVFEWIFTLTNICTSNDPYYSELVRNTLYFHVLKRIGVDINTEFSSRTILSSKDHINFVRLLLSEGIGIDKDTIRVAFSSGNKDFTKFLVEELKVDLSDAVHYAVVFGDVKDLEYVIEKGARIVGDRLFYHCVRRNDKEMIECLISNGLDVTYESGLLKFAVAKNNKEMFEYLLGKGLRISEPNELLNSAVEGKAIDMLLYLMEKFPECSLNFSFIHLDETPLKIALYCHYFDIAIYLLELGADINLCSGPTFSTPIKYSVMERNFAAVKFLVEHGADINKPETYTKRSPLHSAARNAVYYNKEIFEYLLENGADVKSTDEYGNTPLHVAAITDNFYAVERLVEHGADINAKNFDNETAEMLSTSDLIKEFLRMKMSK